MNWLISANAKMYDHASSFAHHGSVDWRQGLYKYAVGDTVYIYFTNPIQRIRYKCKVTKINMNFSQIRDDEEYWLDDSEYKKSLNGKFFNLQLIEEVDSAKLSFKSLLKNGLNGAPQGSLKLSQNLETYISLVFNTANDEFFPEVLDSNMEIFEGLKKPVLVNKYERSSIARAKCLEARGNKYICEICEFDFQQTYGELGKDFIHVHHITPIHTIGQSYKIDYVNDLIPVCPNCHAMLHRKVNGIFYSISALKELIKQIKGSANNPDNKLQP